MPKVSETTLEINLNALSHNFHYLKSKLRAKTKFLAVVKAFAYGSDAIKIAKHLSNMGIDYLAVAYTKEGIALRKSGIELPIMVLHPQPIHFSKLIQHELEPCLYSEETLRNFLSSIDSTTQHAIHLKFNTGLNRLGFRKENISKIATLLSRFPNVSIKSIYSHLAASEDLLEKNFTLNQIRIFENLAKKMTEEIGYTPWKHLCNTSGILNYPQAHFDMVRSGIGLYGFGNSEKESANLRPIASLKTIISQIHHVRKGDSVGYNRGHICQTETKTATLPLGHADGISRNYGNGNGFVYVNEKKARIIGNVCMDMIMIDVSHIDCKEGDEVIVFDEYHSAAKLSKSGQTISYELITAISQRVKRVIVK